jgi:hypothetical protein
MQKLFDAADDSPLVLAAANEDFPSAPVAPEPLEINKVEVRGWSAYDIWHRRIRLRSGVTSLFLPGPC